MQLIPVIDLKAGQVVRAVRGERSHYRPISSCLCPTSDPVAVARRLLDYTASPLLYVADLDALAGEGVQTDIIARLLEALPATELWLDAGYRDLDGWRDVSRALHTSPAQPRPVFASEALASPSAAREALAHADEVLLSLDSRPDGLADRAGCWSDPSLWPSRVILMTLERVGSFGGPDLETLRQVRASKPGLHLIGAGGIRDADDLRLATAAGAAGWLVASALHDLRIPAKGKPARRS